MCYGAVLLADYERKARKSHRCSECRKAIPAGETYHDERLAFDGHAYGVKTCARCHRLKALVNARYEDVGIADDCPLIGSLRQRIREHVRERRWVRRLRGEETP